MAAWARAWPAAAPSAPRPLPSPRPAGSELPGLATSAGEDASETGSALLDKAGRLPILTQYLKFLGLDPAHRGSGPCADGVGWADRSRPGHSKHPIEPVGQRWYPLKLLGTDLVSHRHPACDRGSIPPLLPMSKYLPLAPDADVPQQPWE
jgi:hypothetical protein